jgi:MerR family transcriptional regulator, heat shock protein HspR
MSMSKVSVPKPPPGSPVPLPAAAVLSPAAGPGGPAPSAGVYGISVAAELAECGIQALRLYEQRGLISPARTVGGTRRYSLDNVNEVRRITGLLDSGLNLAGISQIFRLEHELDAIKAEVAQLREQLQATGRPEKADQAVRTPAGTRRRAAPRASR